VIVSTLQVDTPSDVHLGQGRNQCLLRRLVALENLSGKLFLPVLGNSHSSWPTRVNSPRLQYLERHPRHDAGYYWVLILHGY
jgi:hypothetical protein